MPTARPHPHAGFQSLPDQAHGLRDQADGLRRLFAGARQCIVPVVQNAHVAGAGVLLERLTAAFTDLGARTLVVDAGDAAPLPHELAQIDLPACIEALSPGVSYLAARGLPLRHVDARGSCAAWLSAVEDAAPQADVIVLHAGASDLARLLGNRTARPVLMLSGDSDSLTDAYASMKFLSQRSKLMVFDLLLACADPSRATRRRLSLVAERLTGCADAFLGTVMRECVLVAGAPLGAPASLALRRLATDQLLSEDTSAATVPPYPVAPYLPQARPPLQRLAATA
jgi:flagellar biosynthesis protein FlhG